MTQPLTHTPFRSLVLRPYQEEGLKRIEAMLAYRRSVLAVAPTGAGKGTMAVSLIADVVRAGGRALFVVHRREILLDMRERLAREGIRAGLVMGGQKPDREAPVQIASVQTLLGESRRYAYDLMVTDEAHHYAADEWGNVCGRVKTPRTVGFTATPLRSDGRTLGDMFQGLVHIVSYSELLSQGFIVPCRVLRPECPFKTDLAKSPVDAYLRYTPRSRAFIFVRSLPEGREVVDELSRVGIRAAIVDTYTPHAERDDAVRKLRSGELEVIVNFYTMTEGVDVPEVETIVLARQCAHEGAYLQMVGRALRPAPGKERATLLDLMGASFRFGFPTEDRSFRLHWRSGAKSGRHVDESVLRAREQPERALVLDIDLYEAHPDDEAQRRYGRRRIDWAKLPLGIRSDSEIAFELGVHADTVRAARIARGIQTHQSPNRLDWSDPRVVADLAELSLTAFAERYRIHHDTARKARDRLGIMLPKNRRGVPVDVDWDRLPLGKVSDKALAAELGCAQATVLYARRKRSIPPYQPRLFGSVPVKVWSRDLGKLPDGYIAQRAGIAKATVRKRRQRAGIPACQSDAFLAGVDWSAQPLGQVPDRELAERLKVSRWHVQEARRALGIAPYRGHLLSGRSAQEQHDHDDERDEPDRPRAREGEHLGNVQDEQHHQHD